jgi:hypothetical protein
VTREVRESAAAETVRFAGLGERWRRGEVGEKFVVAATGRGGGAIGPSREVVDVGSWSESLRQREGSAPSGGQCDARGRGGECVSGSMPTTVAAGVRPNTAE